MQPAQPDRPGLDKGGAEAVQAAYRDGEDWLAQVLDYIGDNYHFLHDFLGEQLPEVRITEPEGTYLVWVDFRPLGVEEQFCRDRLMDEARVYLDDGALFGPEGEGFARFNIACPRSILAEALERIVKCFNRKSKIENRKSKPISEGLIFNFQYSIFN